MDILKSSQLVIFSHSTIFITFSTEVLQVLSSNSYKVRGGENRKWRWIFAFDRCVVLGYPLLFSANDRPGYQACFAMAADWRPWIDER